MHHGALGPARPPPAQSFSAARQTLAQLNESVWIQIGRFWQSIWDRLRRSLTLYPGQLAELMGNLDEAMGAYERALRHNPQSIPAMTAISCVLRTREEFQKAAEYLQAILRLDETNGEAWGNLGMLAFKRLSLDLALIPPCRSLLLDDGRSPAGLYRVPERVGPSTKPQGEFLWMSNRHFRMLTPIV